MVGNFFDVFDKIAWSINNFDGYLFDIKVSRRMVYFTDVKTRWDIIGCNKVVQFWREFIYLSHHTNCWGINLDRKTRQESSYWNASSQSGFPSALIYKIVHSKLTHFDDRLVNEIDDIAVKC